MTDPKRPAPGPTTARAAGDGPRPVSRPSSAPAPVDAAGKTKDLLQSAPKLEIPKGGGAIRGIGEKFQANPVTGTASFSIPIALSPGRNGFQPALSLAYDSGAGNGPFGLGWNVALPSVRRKTDKGLPRYRDATDGDVFVISEAEDLTPWQVFDESAGWSDRPTESRAGDYTARWYRPRVEAGFSRIERWTASDGTVHWRTWSNANVQRIYGLTGQARVCDPDQPTHVFEWLLEEERDELGNVTTYEYETVTTPDAGLQSVGRLLPGNTPTYTYPKRIFCGNASAGTADGGFYFEVVFDYGEHAANSHKALGSVATRLDPFSRYRSGFDIRCTRLCQRILVFHRFDNPTESVDDVSDDATLVRSTELTHTPSAVGTTLASVTVKGWDADGVPLAMPAVEMDYAAASPASSVQFVVGMEDLPRGVDMSQHQWVDLDGEGLAGLLTEQAGSWFFKRNAGRGELEWAAEVAVRPLVELGGGGGGARFADVNGDGRQELVVLGRAFAGSFGRTASGGWTPLKTFQRVPNLDWNDPNLRWIDLDGDGLADVLVSEDTVFTWYPSEGEDGFGEPAFAFKANDERKGPTVVFASEAESIFLADMSGSGLTDLVRIRNGEACYWPNRGFGKFGAMVRMGGAPHFDAPDLFDPSRIRLADIDGAGPADLLYLGRTGVRYWLNQSGNRFGSETQLPVFIGTDAFTTVSVADLRGDGTACIVWASPLIGDAYAPLRYVRLMSEGKPYLLKEVRNGLGRTTTLSYTPSTEFCVDDRRAGRPWATRLPFPVQCLTEVRVADAVTGWSNTSSYAYHHGYYDPAEREFRGFGKVEQLDTEALPLDGETSDLPPVRTVTWFHTGAWQQQGALEDAYAAEYFVGDYHAFARTACALGTADADPAALSARETREAYRALKGRPLRQEVFCDDDSEVVGVPYAVTETAFTASRLQPADDDRRGVFLVTPLQTLTTHYERNAADPRVQQQRTLEVDAYGTVTKAITVAYPRRGTGHDPEQLAGVVLVARTEVIHDVDTAANPERWHVGVPWRSRSWQFTPDPAVFEDSSLFDALVDPDAAFGEDGAFGSLRDWLDLAVLGGSGATTEVLDWDAADGAAAWLRLLADKITTYDDGGDELDAGTIGDLALPHQAYQLAYTATQAAALDTRLTALGLSVTVLDQGYVELTDLPFLGLIDVAGTWVRSGTQARDAANFHVPTAVTDPFGATTTVAWHASYLFPASVTDALSNGVAVAYDLRALAPASLTDPNRNVTLARYDALGRVTAVARASDTGDGETDLGDPSQLFTYDLTTVPASAYGKVRDTHASDSGTTGWIETYSYSDGGGKVVMQKATAPDGQWIGSGRVVLNNKGLPIKQYEPFFADDPDFEAQEGFEGVTPVITYDPVGRATRVDLPNGTLRRITFDPWTQATWDENDTIDESTASVGLKATVPAGHKNTPTVVRLDAQGRPYKTLELLAPAGDPLVTTLTLDVAGNPTAVFDARANAAMSPWATQTQTFDLLGRPIDTHSADGGDATALLDAAGQPRFVWKSGNLCEEAEFDALRRRVRTWEWVTSGTPVKTLRERFVYGEALYAEDDEDTGDVDESYDPRDDDLRGRLYEVYDGAGKVQAAYDWKGNPVRSIRRFLQGDEGQGEWTDAGAYPFAGDDAVSAAGVAADAEADLETGMDAPFVTLATFDALDRVVSSTAPDGQVTANGYDAAGRLFSVDVGSTHYVTAIVYNARGQRLSIAYGNAVETVYTYEADTFRLATLVTTRPSLDDDPDDGFALPGLQSLTYSYDAVGNIVGIADAAQDIYYTDNATVTPDQDFGYDALYRLVSATGREKGDRAQPFKDDPNTLGIPASGAQVRSYTELYTYDEVGNIVTLVHKHEATTLWTRTYTYAPESNRLATTTEAPGTVSYAHDDRGNLVYLPPMRFDAGLTPNIEVTFRDQMKKVYLDADNTAVYHYDSAGQRVRKVVKTGPVEDRRYVGSYEIWTSTVAGDLRQARSTLHVLDGQSRICMIETETITDGAADGTVTVRYQLGNHLGTACIEVDETGGVISYAEYHPYGSTAWWSNDGDVEVSQKRYRYTGMERDEETGLQCHGVRYYAPWLGRWTSADPIGLGDGVNRYAYCRGGPVGGRDESGLRGGGKWPPDPPAATPAPSTPVEPVSIFAEGYSDNPNGDACTFPVAGGPYVQVSGQTFKAVPDSFIGPLAKNQRRDSDLVKGLKAQADAPTMRAETPAEANDRAIRDWVAANPPPTPTMDEGYAVLRGNWEAQARELMGQREPNPQVPVPSFERYYRAMSQSNFQSLMLSNRVSATDETMLSPTLSYSRDYRGVVIGLNVRSGTTDALVDLGVRDQSKATARAYPTMPGVFPGWAGTNAFFKKEGSQINIGLGQGDALDEFNENLISYEVLGD